MRPPLHVAVPLCATEGRAVATLERVQAHAALAPTPLSAPLRLASMHMAATQAACARGPMTMGRRGLYCECLQTCLATTELPRPSSLPPMNVVELMKLGGEGGSSPSAR
jgi:hypothetical protein